MSVDLHALATWTYDSGVITHIASQQSVEIDISAVPALHLILSAPRWKHLGDKTNYSSDPADWVERRLYFNRAQEDPPVIGVEQNIGQDDRVDYTVYLLEDSPEFSVLIQDLTDTFNALRSAAYTKAETRQFLKTIVRLFQKADLISGDIGD